MKYIDRFGLICAFLLVAAGCAQPAPPPAATTLPAPTPNPVERGKYIVSTSACHDCHTPTKMGPNGPEPDMDRALSGHPEAVKITTGPKLTGPWMAAGSNTFTAWSGPWGISFTANLTPDDNTGIGQWSEQTFIDTIRKGKHMGTSRDLLPPMPWPVYKNFTDDDLKAIFAYLRTIPKVHNRVPDPILAPPPPAKK